jgi:hypothetical protein
MAMAKPVVVGSHGVVGFPEQVINSGPDQNGSHGNGESSTDIAWGIKEVLKDRKKAKKWGKNGRQKSSTMLHMEAGCRANPTNIRGSSIQFCTKHFIT